MFFRNAKAAIKGYLKYKSRSPSMYKNNSGTSILTPHIFNTKVRLLDIDLNLHMNSAKYLEHAEMARWHFLGSIGVIETAIKNNWKFLIASQSIKYRKDIKPFKKFKVLTTIDAIEDKWIYLSSFIVSEKGLIHAHINIKAAIVVNRKRALIEEIFKASVYSEEEFRSIKSLSEKENCVALENWDNSSILYIKQVEDIFNKSREINS